MYLVLCRERLSAGLSASSLKLWGPFGFLGFEGLGGGWVGGSFGLTCAGFKVAC